MRPSHSFLRIVEADPCGQELDHHVKNVMRSPFHAFCLSAFFADKITYEQLCDLVNVAANRPFVLSLPEDTEFCHKLICHITTDPVAKEQSDRLQSMVPDTHKKFVQALGNLFLLQKDS